MSGFFGSLNFQSPDQYSCAQKSITAPLLTANTNEQESKPRAVFLVPFIKKERLYAEQGHSSDSTMKTRVLKATLGHYKNKSCGNTCSYGGKCLEKAGLDLIHDLQLRFWGGDLDKPPTASERNGKIAEILKAAFIPTLKTFKFSIGTRPRLELCEKSFLRALGLLSSETELSTSQWRRQKTTISDSFDELATKEKRQNPERPGLKEEMILSFIESYIKDHCDIIDTISDDDLDQVVVKHVLPFGSIDSFFQEYRMQKNLENMRSEEEFGCCRTFQRAYKKVRRLILVFITLNIFLNRSLTE
jgi:hypothetical protein